MRKVFLVFALLALAACFAAAEAADSTQAPFPSEMVVSENDTHTGSALVEARAEAVVVQKPVTRLHLTAAGIAISEGNPFDFMHAKVAVGSVKVSKAVVVATAEEEAVAAEFVVRRIGVLMLDGQSYHLKDVAVSGEEISAEVYDPATEANASSEAIGEIKVKLFEKPGNDIWAGNLVLNGNAYNIYFLGAQRQFSISEVTEKIGTYCEQYPDDSRCLGVMANCGESPVQCRERAQEYCLNNPSDRGCLQLKKQYCLLNASDERCRQYLKGLCEEYPQLAHCRISTENGRQVIGIDANAVSAVSAEPGEAEATLVSVKQRPGLGIVKNSVSAVKVTSGNAAKNSASIVRATGAANGS